MHNVGYFCLMESPLITHLLGFGPVPEKDRALIEAAFERRMVKEGENLFKGSRICRELFFVEQGVLRIVKINSIEVEVTYYFMSENMFCCILHSFNDEVPASECILAASDATLLAISKADLLALYKEFPYVKPLFEQSMQDRVMKKIQLRNSYLGLDAKSKYKLFLEQQPNVASRVPLRDIASYLEITPQSLSRIRKHI
jgi:CRP-like cAMP-binding protein